MNYVTIVEDKIRLHWDRVIPVEFKQVVYEPEDMLITWEHLKGHTHYSKAHHYFYMTFSKQNLKRINAQFGEIPIKLGMERVTELKKKQENLYNMVQRSNVITNNKDKLPAYNYKLPPLGAYQHEGVVRLSNVQRLPLFVDCGCLSWDSIVSISRGGAGQKVTFEKLHKMFHGPNRKADIFARSFNGERIQLHLIKDVVCSGIKKVYRVLLRDGKNIKATADHEIMTSVGFVRMERLVPSIHMVMVDNLSRHKSVPSVELKAKKNNDKRLAVGQYHPFARKQLSHQGRSHSFLVEEHRLIFEAHHSGMSLNDFIKATYTADFDHRKLRFVDTKTHCIHHKDHDHYNNDPLNLEELTHEGHMRHHTKGYDNFNHGIPEFSKVVSIEYIGKEMTYDIVCDDPHRNFVANGIVVHNCGKTYMALNSIQNHKDKLVIPEGKTLICVKLATIETGWLEDAKKFTNLKLVNLWVKSGDKKRKQKILARLEEPADAYVINHEGVLVFQDALKAKKFKKVIVDESTILKGFHSMAPQAKGGKFGKALMSISEHADWRVIMSGTPAPNSIADLFGQFLFLDPDGLMLEPSFNDFTQEYFKAIDLRMKSAKWRTDNITGEKFFIPLKPRDPKKWVPKEDSIHRVGEIINKLAFRVRMKDHLLDMPELTLLKRKIEMSVEQEHHYKEMEKFLKVEINDERITASIKLTQLMKLRQITGGFIIDHQDVPQEIKSNPKITELDSILNDEIGPEAKVVIYAEYQYEIKMMETRYKDRGVVTVYGGNTSTKNLANIEKFINDPNCKTIILHPKSAAHGITFTVAHYMIFYSFSHSAENNYQCKKRIERAGQKHPMFIFYLICDDSIDEDMYEVVLKKDDDQELLLDGDDLLVNIWRSNGTK